MNATDATAATAAVLGTLFGLLLIAGLYVWMSLALSEVFRKSGVEGWKAWVPILNSVVLLQLAGLSPWALLVALVPVLGWIALVVLFALAYYRLNVAFGFGAGMTVLAVLAAPVWASVIGWGSARWVGRETDAASRTRGAGPRRIGIDPGPLLPSFAPAADPDEVAMSSQASPTDGASAFAPPPPYVPPAAAAAPPTGPVRTLPPADQAIPAPAAPAPAAPAPAAPAPAGPMRGAAADRVDEPTPAPAVAARAADAQEVPASSAGGWTPASAFRPDSAEPHSADVGGYDADAGRWQGFALDAADLSAEVTGAVPGAPSPISAVPAVPTPAVPIPPQREAFGVPDAATTAGGITRPPVTHVPRAAASVDDREPWAPRRSSMSEADAFPEASGPVSAIAGAPDAGAPRSARSSVSAYHGKPEIPEEQDVLEHTIVARRKRTDWTLVPPTGAPIALSADVVILGRRPAADPAFPGAQLVSIHDGTVSKTHARLQLRDDRWYVTDLDSTNGVLFATVLGTEVEAPAGEEVEAGDRFLLGDAEVRLHRSDG